MRSANSRYYQVMSLIIAILAVVLFILNYQQIRYFSDTRKCDQRVLGLLRITDATFGKPEYSHKADSLGIKNTIKNPDMTKRFICTIDEVMGTQVSFDDGSSDTMYRLTDSIYFGNFVEEVAPIMNDAIMGNTLPGSPSGQQNGIRGINRIVK